jgi:FKBP-type peptidyl-prolyl cis-trans isomerase FkpA
MKRLFRRSSPIWLAALLSTAGCLGDAAGPVDPTDLTFATALGVNLAEMTLTSSGLYYKDEVVGTGAVAQAGFDASVAYTGWLHTGQQFDSGIFTVERIGVANVIEGWNEGLQGMRVGGRRLLVIPSHLAYGPSGRGVIPPHATLVFRVEIRSVTPR